jgi:surfactin synthase thioesterase subunit
MTCIGATNAKRQAIFLHGIITETKGKGPQPNYLTLLDRVAKDADMRIAMPVSKAPCRGDSNKRCWSGNDGKEITAIWNEVIAASSQCIDTKKPFGLIGHSNGGYMTGRIIMRCLKPQPKWAIAGGSAGDISHTAGAESKDCAALTVFIGKKDLTNQKAKQFVKQMHTKNRKANLIEYSGAHDFQAQSLSDLILQLD